MGVGKFSYSSTYFITFAPNISRWKRDGWIGKTGHNRWNKVVQASTAKNDNDKLTLIPIKMMELMGNFV